MAVAGVFIMVAFSQSVKTSFIYYTGPEGEIFRIQITEDVVFFIKLPIQNGRFYKNITKMINFKQTPCIVEKM